MDENNSPSATDIRQQQQKQLFIDQLRKTPIVQIVCEKIGVSRSSFYRWKQADAEFSKACDEALEDGYLLVNDLAESSLMTAIRDQSLPAVMFWLRNHHAKYRNKLDVTGSITTIQEKLTDEQQQVVNEALRLLSLSEDGEDPKGENKNEAHT
jgi:hypothetical protein